MHGMAIAAGAAHLSVQAVCTQQDKKAENEACMFQYFNVHNSMLLESICNKSANPYM
jgi:hypothetical protein